ncbi:hypothetical protein, partial [Acinetobacter baumannii]|uniref:hypothetical protein n=1 Tax=Acinetobacter baumannii TaxID=470 RepID=UPI001C080680
MALDALEALWAEGCEASLVIVGKPGWGNDHFMGRLRSHPELGRRLHWHAKVSDEELSEIYAASDAL